MEKGNLIASILFLLFSSAVAIQSYRLDVGTLFYPKAGFLPFLASCLLGILAVILLIVSAIKRKRTTFGGESVLLFNRKTFHKVLCVIASLFAYAILLIFLGFFLDTLLFVGFLLIVVERQKWYIVIIGGSLAALTSYFVFDVLLNLRLPKGFLFG